jgi:hypothetical protein
MHILLLEFSVIYVSFIICIMTLMPLAGLHLCVGLCILWHPRCNLLKVNIIITRQCYVLHSPLLFPLNPYPLILIPVPFNPYPYTLWSLSLYPIIVIIIRQCNGDLLAQEPDNYIYTYISIYIHTYISLYTHTCICMYIYIFTYI